jgi:acyl-CoA thioesterase
VTTTGGFHDVVGLDSDGHDEGTATVVMHADERHLNAHGSVHGGAIATLCDAAMGEAVFSAGADAPVTIEMKVTYLEPAHLGDLVARAQVRRRGKRITIVEAEVSQDGDVVALALATFSS